MSNKNMVRKLKSVFLAAWTAVMLSACATATAPDTKADANTQVKALAQARWDALVRGDVTAAYAYMSPASRSVVTLAQYQQMIRVGFWKQAVVESVSCEPEICKVGVEIVYDHKLIKDVRSPLSESWAKEDGKWWFVLKK